MADAVVRNEELSRYEITVGGRLAGVADFRVSPDGTVILPHTQIETGMQGRGLGARLVRAALDDLRSAGRRVDPQCWYVAQFIDENPSYKDLLAG